MAQESFSVVLFGGHVARAVGYGRSHGKRHARGRADVQRHSLRVWIVSQSYLPFYGGITEHVWHLSAALAARGHSVTILTGRPTRPAPMPDPDPPGVRVVRAGWTVRLPSNGARACMTLGCDWPRRIALPDPAPDIVHIQSPLEPGLPLWALHHLPGVKIGTFHTGGRGCHWGYRWFSPWLARSSGRLAVRIAVSREAARYIAGRLPPADRVIPNGVAANRFAPALAARPACGDELVALYVGRCDPRKGLNTLLDALARVSARDDARGGGPRLRLCLVGDGPLLPALARRARRERLAVTCAGAVPRRELPHYYASADLFVAPSTDGESFGISLLEAAAAGRPIIAAGIDAYRETLRDSGAALFFEPGSSEDLARALITLRGDPVRRAAMGDAGARYARRFEWERIAGEIEQVYRDALRRAPARRLSRWILSNPRSVSASSTS
jgi:phosphatidyl-myo-inositol alpha-mannosyltransferase